MPVGDEARHDPLGPTGATAEGARPRVGGAGISGGGTLARLVGVVVLVAVLVLIALLARALGARVGAP